MIIAPLMWPILKMAIGISYERKAYIKEGLSLLLICIVVSIISAFCITYLSPIKLLNDEILSRTNPTLLDVFVALIAGGVAALAIIQPRISETLAGVAIATSLMPPLCVSGIGLALIDFKTFAGGLILFFANTVAIIFITIFIFTLVGIKRKTDSTMRRSGIIFISIMLIVTAIPLFLLLRKYAFRNFAYNKTQRIIQQQFMAISPSIYVANIKTSLEIRDEKEVIQVEAEVEIPEDFSINYQQKESIAHELEQALDTEIDLNLRLLRTISVISEQDILSDVQRDLISQTIIEEIPQINTSLSIESIKATEDTTQQQWNVSVILHGDLATTLTHKQRDDLEVLLEEKIESDVALDIKIVSLVQLRSSPDIEQEKNQQSLEKAIQQAFWTISPEISVESIAIKESEEEGTLVDIEIKAPTDVILNEEILGSLKEQLTVIIGKEIRININVIEKLLYQL